MSADVNELLRRVEESERRLDALPGRDDLGGLAYMTEYNRLERDHLERLLAFQRAMLALPDLTDRERARTAEALDTTEGQLALHEQGERAHERAEGLAERVLADEDERAAWLTDLHELVAQVERAVEVYAQIPWPHDTDGHHVGASVGQLMLELSVVTQPLGALYDVGRQTTEERALGDRVLAVHERYDDPPGMANLEWEVEMLVESTEARLDDGDDQEPSP